MTWRTAWVVRMDQEPLMLVFIARMTYIIFCDDNYAFEFIISTEVI